MPRFRSKPSTKTRPSSPDPKRKKKTKKSAKSEPSKDEDRHSSKMSQNSDSAKGKQRQIEPYQLKYRRDQVDSSTGLLSDADASNAGATWLIDEQAPPPLQQVYARAEGDLMARADDFGAPFIPGLMVPSSASSSSSTSASSSTSSPTSTRVTNPIASIHHNVPLILCIVVGAVVVTATLSVGLAWILRLACCAGERRARRKRRLDRSTWSPSALNATNGDREKAVGRSSLDSVTVKGDDDLEGKDAKIDALFGDSASDGHLGPTVPVLSYADAGQVQEAPKSTWNGKGWTLFDPPVAPLQPPEPAATNPPANRTGGGNYGAARGELADQNLGGFTWPTSVERQPSFIERLVQRHHQASELPTTATLPYPFQAKPTQPASRMASLGGAANRAVMNMLPVTLRNAATTASRQRATRKRYHDMQPYLDSDFEGTIGGKDRELPMARRLRRTEERMAVDCTTEEESSSPLENGARQLGHFDNVQLPRVLPVMIPQPMINLDGKAVAECTPGLAGVGAAWSRRGSHQSSLIGPHVPVVVRPSVATAQLSKVIEPNRASMLPFPAMEGDRRTRLLGSVGRWLGKVTEAGEVADPYTALSPRPDRRLTKNGSLRSDYTSTTLADSASTSETQVDAQTSSSAPGRSERLLQRVDADQAEHDRQQRRLLRKARMFTSADADTAAQQGEQQQKAADANDDAAANVSRAPSIRPQFFATTDLKSWLEPNKVSTTHGFKVLEEQDAASSVTADPFASDVEVKPKLRKCESYDSFVSEARSSKPKLRSSSSKQKLRSAVFTSPRGSVKAASRQKREALGSLNTAATKKATYSQLPSACQSSAAITVVSSVFDDAFAAQLNKVAKSKTAAASDSGATKRRRAAQLSDDAKAKAKAEADAAVRDAWRRRKMLSISSRGSQRSRTTRTMVSKSEDTGVLLSREESMRSQPSVYSELTAPSDYQFQAPLLSDSARGAMLTSCGASTIDPVSEEMEVPDEVANPHEDAKTREEEEAQLKKQLKKEAKKEARRQQRRDERQRAKKLAAVPASAAAESKRAVPSTSPTKAAVPALHQAKEVKGRIASAGPALQSQQRREPTSHSANGADAMAQQLAIRRTIRKQRSISLGVARNQFAMAHVDVDNLNIPDSPWTSSDSDISIRRWGEPRRDDSLRYQNRGTRHHHQSSAIPSAAEDTGNKRSASKHARANSYYYGMGAGGDLRDFC
ncbi:uncharacterized protein UTRI_04652_B [Ustilago trichophora]|uniref:Transmembrane protein n=1 Tax=Ustilago trichophora TaxID=86804 RepID=A0A5C3EDY2_9BASI|nr:uncharacterized protein UTRI_04652_B [Ustilago trichophora]